MGNRVFEAKKANSFSSSTLLLFSLSTLLRARVLLPPLESKMQTLAATRAGIPLASAKAQARSRAAPAAAALAPRIVGATPASKKTSSLGAFPLSIRSVVLRPFRSLSASPNLQERRF